MLIIGASIPFFKLSGAVIIFIIPLYLLLSREKKRYYPGFIFLLLLFTIPFVYRNYVQTGYPLYPYTFISWGEPDWKVPLPMTDRISRYISLTNKYFNQAIPGSDWAQPSWQWIKSWFSHIPLVDQLIILLAIAGLPVFFLISKPVLKERRAYRDSYAGTRITFLT